MSELLFAVQAPIHVSRVGLRARDASVLAAFYRTALGLEELGRSDGAIRLGAGGRELLQIAADPFALPDDPRAAGLFHTAFLLPSRADLGRWVKHAARERLMLSGASDHLVSEAIYLDDPEGNGIEIYADRPAETWAWRGSEVEMATVRLDMAGLIAAADGAEEWTGAPAGTVIGHVHLRVGDPARAERWWRKEVRLDTMAHYGEQAVFLASGGYHHHIGANNWRSRGAGMRDPTRAGLDWVELAEMGGGVERELRDPWGTAVRLAPAEA